MTARARVERLIAAARRIADPKDALGEEARSVLPASTGLSPEGVELALRDCLETHPSFEDVTSLCESVTETATAHVLLSANVFTAAHRAIALGLAAAPEVFVRASRREPEMTRLLELGAPGTFRVVRELAPRSGDSVFAYGSDGTMRSFEAALPAGVALRAHGSGLGLVMLELSRRPGDVPRLARAVASDVVVFDQRGCLSPRIVGVLGSAEEARAFGVALAHTLGEIEKTVPRGRMDSSEIADAVRYRDTTTFAAELLPAGLGSVGIDVRDSAPIVVPPVGRHVHVLRVTPPFAEFSALAPAVAALGVDGAADFRETLAALFRGARVSAPGRMQRPPFDGAVDRRPW